MTSPGFSYSQVIEHYRYVGFLHLQDSVYIRFHSVTRGSEPQQDGSTGYIKNHHSGTKVSFRLTSML